MFCEEKGPLCDGCPYWDDDFEACYCPSGVYCPDSLDF